MNPATPKNMGGDRVDIDDLMRSHNPGNTEHPRDESQDLPKPPPRRRKRKAHPMHSLHQDPNQTQMTNMIRRDSMLTHALTFLIGGLVGFGAYHFLFGNKK